MTARSEHLPVSVGKCQRCGKLGTYQTRKAAKRAGKATHPEETLDQYRCGDYWHYGHDNEWRHRPSVLDETLTASPVKLHRQPPQTALAAMIVVARATCCQESDEQARRTA